MEKPIRVALYGNSLFLNGIARSLAAGPWLEIIRGHGEAETREGGWMNNLKWYLKFF